MRQALFICLAVLTNACGAARQGARGPDRPIPAHELAFLSSNDLEAVEQVLEKASSNTEQAASADFLMADLLDATGELDSALDLYFKVIESAHENGASPLEATAAAMGVVAIRDRATRFDERFEELLASLGREQGKLPLEAWYQLMILDSGLSYRAGRYQRSQEAADRAGCLRDWRVAGPFGPWTWTQLDDPRPPGSGSMWPAAVDLGPGRRKSPIREVKSNVCSVKVGNPNLRLNGATWASTTLVLDEPKTVHFRLQTSDGALVLIQNKEVFRRDPRRGWPPYTAWFEAKLPAGAVTVAVMLASESPSPGFSLSALVGDTTEDPTSPSELSRGSIYAKLKAALWWEDIETAWTLIDAIEKKVGEPSGIFLLSKSVATSMDQSLPGEVAYEQARAIDSEAIEKAPNLWMARAHMADREIGEERFSSAISMLEDGIKLCPKEPDLKRRLLAIFLSQGWNAQAQKVLKDLEALQPQSCTTKKWKLAQAKSVNDFAEAKTLATSISKCDASSPALAEELMRSQKWRAALEERERLFERQKTSVTLAVDVYNAASALGDFEESKSALEKALELAPTDETVRLRLADSIAAGGDKAEAKRVIEEGMGIAYGFDPSLISAAAAIEQRPVFKELRIDGDAVIERYKLEGQEFDTAAVFVLDRAVYLVGEDGGSVMLVHSITHLKTDEAVEKYGDSNLPPGALLLTARTIKADGRTMEPEEIAHKTEISFPKLKPGDFVESEYAIFTYPSPIYPGGFDTERFYFENFETAFARSEIVLILPAGMEILADPRGNCPKPVETSISGMKILTWKTGGVLPFPAEPYSPSATEYLPSIRVTSRAGWDNALAKTRDLLADKERRSRFIDKALKEALLETQSNSPEEITEAVYNWVMDKIEPGNDLLEQASHIIVRRSGNRARAFLALLSAAGVSARLAFVKPLGADETEGSAPDLDDWSGTAVMVDDIGWVYLDRDFAPLCYLPSNLRNRPAVFLDNAERVETDGGKTPLDSQKINLKISVNHSGDAQTSVSEKLTGGMAAEWREVFQGNPKSQWRAKFQEAYLSSEIQGAKLESLEVKNLVDVDEPLLLEYKVFIPGFLKTNGSLKRLSLPFPLSLTRKIGGLPTRATPLIMATWIEKEVLAEISLPSHLELKPLSDDKISVETEWGRASAYQTDDGTTVRAGWETIVEVDRIEPPKYQSFLDFVRALDKISNLEIKLSITPRNTKEER